MLVSDQACLSPRVVGQACRFQMVLQWSMSRSPMGLRSGTLVSDGSPIRHFGLRWVFDNNIFGNSTSEFDTCWKNNSSKFRLIDYFFVSTTSFFWVRFHTQYPLLFIILYILCSIHTVLFSYNYLFRIVQTSLFSQVKFYFPVSLLDVYRKETK